MSFRNILPLLVLLLISPASLIAADSPELLVSAEQLIDRKADTRPILLDVRSEQDYESGHLPHALRIDLNAWKKRSLNPDGLADRVYWSDQVGRLGINRDSSVVIYGGSPTDATRAWWTLKYLGVKQVAILDGGFEAWVDAGAPISRDLVVIAAVPFEPEFQADRLATFDEMQTIVKEQSATVIDTRSDAEFNGTGGPGARKGHLPGAVHQEWTNFVTPEGRFKPVSEIKSLLKEQGITPDAKVVTHCQTGGRASLNAFAMELAGYGPVKNYYCGWSEWSAARDAPVE